MKIEYKYSDEGRVVVDLIYNDTSQDTFSFKRPLLGSGYKMQTDLLDALLAELNKLLEHQ